MPWIDEPVVTPAFQGAAPPAEPEGSVLGAAFRRENLIVSTLGALDGLGKSGARYRVPGFDPLSDDNLAGYETYARRFIRAETPAASDAIKRRIDQEERDRALLASSGLPGIAAQFAASLLDPTVFIPIGGQIRKGQSVLSITGNMARAAGGGTALQEAGLQATQETRTLEETAWNVGGATVLGAAFGGAVAPLLRGADGPRVAAAFEAEMRMPGDGEPDPLDPLAMGPVPFDEAAPARAANDADLDAAEALYEQTMGQARAAGDLGAARVARTLTEEEGVAYIDGMARRLNVFDPVLRGLTNEARGARVLTQELADTPLMLEKNRATAQTVTLPDGRTEQRVVWGQATAQSVESAIKRRDAMLGRALETVDDLYIQHALGRARRPGDLLATGMLGYAGRLTPGKMTRPDFQRAVMGALRNGDRHRVPEVQAAAQKLRTEYFDPWKKEAMELGLFGYRYEAGEVAADGTRTPGRYVPIAPEVTTAESYAPRLYDREKIRARRPEFIDRLHRFYIAERDRAAARAEELEAAEAAEIERLALLRGDLRTVLAERAALFAKGQQAVETAARQEARAKGAEGEARVRATDAAGERRAAEYTSLEPVERAYFAGLQRDVARGHGEGRAQSLLQFIRHHGGVRDWNTILPRSYAQRRNLINEKSGRPADALREIAEEAGYLPEGATLNDLADAITLELGGTKVFGKEDVDLVEYERMLAEIGDAMRAADMDIKGVSVEEFAAWYKGEGYIKPTATKAGRRPGAQMREWRALERLRQTEARAADAEEALAEARVLARTLREVAPELTEEATRLRASIAEARADRLRLQKEMAKAEYRAGMSDGELRENAERTVQRILGSPVGRLSYDGPTSGRRGGGGKADPQRSARFKARVLDIPDREIADFLDDNLEFALRSFQRSVAPDVELTRRFGSIDMELQWKELDEEYSGMSRAVERERVAGRLTDEQAETRQKALDKAKATALRDLSAIRDRLRGTYALPEDPDSLAWRLMRTAKTVNYLRMMGGVTISSIPDVARVVFSNGLDSFLGVAGQAFSGNLKGLKLAAEEVKAAGPGFEMVMNNRAMAMADILDDYGRGSKFERGIAAVQSHFGYASLIAPWNGMLKTAAGLTTQTRMLRAIEAGAKIGRVDAEFLAKLGIGEEMAGRIRAEFRRHGVKESGVWSAQTAEWADAAARDAFHDALRKEVDRLIVTPGQEKPLGASTGLGSLLLQFRSYNFAATQRVMLAYTQGLIGQRDAHALMALTSSIGLGMVVGALKTWQYGESVQDWTWNRWTAEGIDRSGVLGVLTDVNMMSEHLTGFGLSTLAGEEISRYSTRNWVGAMAGPTVGALTDAGVAVRGLTGQAAGREMTEADIRAARRLLPFQNLFYVRWLFDAAEQATADALGVERERE